MAKIKSIGSYYKTIEYSFFSFLTKNSYHLNCFTVIWTILRRHQLNKILI
jgi:hypothetical protein